MYASPRRRSRRGSPSAPKIGADWQPTRKTQTEVYCNIAIRQRLWQYHNMAKATFTTADGTSVRVEGSPAELAQFLKTMVPKARRDQKSTRPIRGGRPPQLVDLIESLEDGGFFNRPRDLAAIREALAELGHHYPVTTLSGTMLTQVRKRRLKRMKEDKRWLYAK